MDKQLEVSELLQKAKNSSTKVINEEEVTNSDLETIFKVMNYHQNQLWENLSSDGLSSILDKIILSVETAVDIIIDFMFSTVTNNEDISKLFIDDVLNGGNRMNTLLNDPNSLLPDDLRLSDTDAIKAFNNQIVTIMETKLKSMGQTNFDNLDTTELEDIANKLDKLPYLDDDLKDEIKVVVSGALFSKISPDLEIYSNKFAEAIKQAIDDGDTYFDAKNWRSDFVDLIRKIEATSITRGSAAEKYMADCKKKFETMFDKNLIDLIKKITDSVIEKELDECETVEEINEYVSNSATSSRIRIRLIDSFFDDDKRTEAEKYLENKVSSAKITIKSRPPKVKNYTDSEGNEYVKFKNEVVPVAHHDKVQHKWKIEPKRLSDGNVVITFKDTATGKVIEPSMAKRLRLEYPYEMTVQEWKDAQKQMKEYKKQLEKIEDIKHKIKEEKDEEKKENLVEELRTLTDNLSFYARVLDKLKIFDGVMGHNIEDMIPPFDEERIKITPDIMDNLREMAECSKTMLKSQHDILILEGEAGVGKNIIIDIFAHFTNRPVFVFSCGKRTDVQDLTYLWILDENGSRKLNSKIFNAITTPNAILVLDEINTLDPGIQKRLNGLLDARKSLVVDDASGQREKAEESVLIFGTMNPQGYSGTQPLAADVRSRAHFIYHDYDWLFHGSKGGEIEVSYSDALKIFGNVKYFWKLATGNGFTKNDVKLYEEAILDQIHGNKLTPEKKRILKTFKPISDSDFIWAWNNLFNGGNESEVGNRFGETFVEGMKDIYTIMLYANYIRVRYKATKEGWDTDNLPWDEETNDFFDDISFSPRLAIQALEQFHNGGLTAKDAVIETFVGQLTDVNNRPKVVEFFNTLSESSIKNALTNQYVQANLGKEHNS